MYPKTWLFILFFFIIFIGTICAIDWWMYSKVHVDMSESDIKRVKTSCIIYASSILFLLLIMVVGVYFKPYRMILINPKTKISINILMIVLYIVMFLSILTIDILGWYIFVTLNKLEKKESDFLSVRRVLLVGGITTTVVVAFVIAFGITKTVLYIKKKKKHDNDSISNYTREHLL